MFSYILNIKPAIFKMLLTSRLLGLLVLFIITIIHFFKTETNNHLTMKKKINTSFKTQQPFGCHKEKTWFLRGYLK